MNASGRQRRRASKRPDKRHKARVKRHSRRHKAKAGNTLVPARKFDGTFGVREAERLLWRAGFGPRPGQAADLVKLGLEGAVRSLTRPSGDAKLVGPKPSLRIDPYGEWGHDHLAWMDRMVRSTAPLVERMTLVLHDWFATSRDGVGSAGSPMLEQNALLRANALGNFGRLVHDITKDKAMLIWLNGLGSTRGAVNENYARELMELFTLGADRDAYTEQDVRELARAMSGWAGDYREGQGWINLRFNARDTWDPGAKTIFGQDGRFDWEDGARLVVEHPLHASFFVSKLWSYFVPVPPPPQTQVALESIYLRSGLEMVPVLEAILTSPELYGGPLMVKPPVVYAAGLLRATGQGIGTDAWTWLCGNAGQQLFYPPDVSGWDDSAWLNTGTTAARWAIANQVMAGDSTTPGESYPAESADEAVAKARAFWSDPPLTKETVAELTRFAQRALDGHRPDGYRYGQRQLALRMLVAISPDNQVS